MTSEEAAGSAGRRTRAAQQEATRHNLVLSALANFTEDGYHGASLDKIAADAGYSKGAVYSNFAGKAELFLAVMDHNIAFADEAAWDPLEHPGRHGLEDPPSPADPAGRRRPDEPAAAEAVRAFGLATLEFIGATARDPAMRGAISERLDLMVTIFDRYVADRRPPQEELTTEEVATLLTALDQGAAVLDLGGISIDPAVLREGLSRLMDPWGSGTSDGTARVQPPRSHDVAVVSRLIAEVREAEERQRAHREGDDDPGGSGRDDA
ncbi:TetR/AcrR family transcriptional regulator [Georgenia sp. Z1491]|uniref:TetR/AcrR family transcriptional regulator n=1 Tax=Georgenia sp. Z1491 TaxID=3416707 RepID=UPI003CE93505